MKLKKHLIAIGFALGCFVAGTIVSAGDPRWQAQLDQSAANLQAGHYAKAAAIADMMIAAMVERSGGGEAENRAFATALVHRAIAAAGSGEINGALWDWYVAQDIWPGAAKIDLAPYGAAGEFLARHPLQQPDANAPVTSIKVVKEVVPKFPPGASRYGIAGDLIVQIVVDRNGQPTLPRIIRPLPAPTLSYAALEALRQWRFQPAVRNGETVPAVFNLTVHYKL